MISIEIRRSRLITFTSRALPLPGPIALCYTDIGDLETPKRIYKYTPTQRSLTRDHTPRSPSNWTSTRFQHPTDTLLQRAQRAPVLANRQYDKSVPNRVASPSKPIDPRPNTVVGRGLGTGREETLGEVSSVEAETNEVTYHGWDDRDWEEEL